MLFTRRFFSLLCLFCVLANLSIANNPDSLKGELKNPSRPAFLFIENKGQVKALDGSPRSDVLYTLKANGVSIFVRQDGLSYQFSHKTGNRLTAEEALMQESLPPAHQLVEQERNEESQTSLYRLDMQLLEASANPTVEAAKPAAYFENYFTLSSGQEEISKARAFRKVIIKEVYPHVDWVLYIQEEQLKYDFILHPGAKISDIKMKYSGAQGISNEKDGSLSIRTPLSEITEAPPFSYQLKENKKEEVESGYCLIDEHTVGFRIADHQPDQTLVIDPSVSWATYYGGSYFESGTSTAIAANGDFYLAGETESANAISSGGHQNTFGGNEDAFLVKFDANGHRLWATYFGGERDDKANHIQLDRDGSIYMVGETESNSQIAHNGFRETYGGNGDAFLAKFNTEGDRLWATYYGGEGFDSGHALGIDSQNNLYLTGITESTSGIASGGMQNSPGGSFDTFLAKFTSNGERLWATYYGGSGKENAVEGHKGTITLDQNDDLYISGWTNSDEGIASGGFQNSRSGSGDAYLAKFNGQGNLLWATYYGGSDFDAGRGVLTDQENNILLSGTTNSTSNIASDGFQETSGGNWDAFLVKFTSNGERIWATYYGGSGQDEAKEGSLVIDDEGNIYMGGFTNGSDGIAACGFQNTIGGSFDAFLVGFDAAGNRLWGSYFGGPGFEISFGTELDPEGNLYMAGWTSSEQGIAYNGFQNSFGGSGDAFIVKIDPFIETLETPEIAVEGEMPLCPEESVLLTGPVLEEISYEWRRGTELLSEGSNSISVSEAGKYTLTILNACDTATSDTVVVTSFAAAQAPEIMAEGPTSFCLGESVKLSVLEEEHVSYQWQQNGQPVGGDSHEFTASESGLYSCVISSDCGSLSSEEKEIKMEPVPSAPIPAETQFTQCGPGSLTLSVEGSESTEFRWYESDTANDLIPGESSPEFETPTLSRSKTYYVSAINGSCESPRTAIEAIIQTPLEANAGEDTTISLGEQTQLQASGGDSYKWSPSEGLSDPNIPNPLAEPDKTTTYTLEATDLNGCSATDEVVITVRPKEEPPVDPIPDPKEDPGAFIPNAFSPNHDGINDVWEIINIENFPECTVEVFDRWGVQVFKSTAYKEAWDGSYQNQKVPAGSYTYFIQLDNEQPPISGALLIFY